jgi:hypothetical protein
MKNKINLIYMVGLLMVASLHCKSPIEELNKFKLNLNGQLANSLVKLRFNTNDLSNPEPKNVSITITGQDAKYIFDANGFYNFSARSGVVDLILGPNAYPTNENPIIFTVEAIAENCAPIRQDVFIFSKTQKVDVTLTFKSNYNLPSNITFKSTDLNFLGKKAIDTVKFDLIRHDGVKFTVKYPTQGLTFIKRTSKKFKIGEKIRIEAEYRDSAVIILDTVKVEIKEIIGVQIYNGQVANEYKVTGYKMEPQENVTTKKIFLGYKIRDTVPIYETRTIFDTVPLGNVKAVIYSQSEYFESGFYDENGDYVEKPRFFANVIGLPEVYLYENNNYNSSVIPVYSNANGGSIFECTLPNKQISNLFFSGVAQSEKGNYFYSIKRAIKLNDLADFKITPEGSFMFTFRDKLIDGHYFLFKSSEIGCGYSSVNVQIPYADFSSGIFGYVSIKGKYGNYSYGFNEKSNDFRIPTFAGDYIISSYLNHMDNICAGQPPLFESSSSANLCNFLTTPYNFTVFYNSDDYLKTLPPFLPVKLTAKIQCSGGNFVIPPDLVLLYRKLDCWRGNLKDANYSSIELKDGEITTNSFQKDQAYEIRYDRISSEGNLLNIYDTIVFDSKLPEQTIKDEGSDYWQGKIKFNGKSFAIDFTFDNRKLKYKINGCGD